MSAPTRTTPLNRPVTSPVAIVTGASQGLGLALAEALADRGWALVVDARRADRLDAAVAHLASRTTVVGVAGDVTDPAHRAELARVAASIGTVGLLVNNASTLGASPLPALDAIDPDTFLRIFDVNVVAPLALVHDLRRAPRRARHRREHHVRRRGRGLPRVGWLRRVEGRARARESRSSPRSVPTCASSSSIPATCAPRCTRTRSPVRTSPTARSPSRACPRCSR